MTPNSDLKLPEGYGFVFGGLFLTVISNFYLVLNVVKLRRKFGIKYPAVYADYDTHVDSKGILCKKEDVDQFNCAQRAHQNTVENLPTVQLLGTINGLLFPQFSGCCLAIYAVGRVVYGWGYMNKGPDGRMAGGIISHLGDFPLYLCTAYSAVTLLTPK